MSTAFGPAGELFVRVRPNTAGFKEEAAPGIQAAGTNLGKIFVTAFSVVAIGDVIKHTVQAAVQQQATFATLNKVVSNAGAANTVHSDTVDNLIKQQAALKGFSVADTAGAFTKLVSVTRDSAQAFRLLSVAEDLARGTGKDLGVSALAVDKAFQGSFTSLARYGIIVHPVTTAVTALKDAHTQAADAGAKFTAEENLAYAAAVKQATLQDKVLTGQVAIAAIQQRFGGTSATFAQTAAGQYDRLKVSVDQLAVSVGTALLPPVTSLITHLAGYAEELTHDKQVTDAAKTAGHDLGVVFRDIEAAVKTVGPPLLEIAKYTLEVAQAVGAPALLAAVGVYEGIGLATTVWAKGEALVNTVIAAGQPAKVAALTETAALTAALEANSAALTGQAVAASADQLTLDGLAASEVAVGVAAEGAAVGGIAAFGEGLAALALSPAGIVLGLAAAAGAVVLLSGKSASLADDNNAVTASIRNLNAALAQEATAAPAAAKAASAAVQAARDQITANVTTLSSNASTAISVLGHARDITDQWVLAIDRQRASVALTDPVIAHDLALIEQLSGALGAIPPTTDIRLLINNQDPTAGIAAILSGLTQIDSVVLTLAQQLSVIGAPANSSAAGTSTPGRLEKEAQAGAQTVLDSATRGPIHDTLTAAAKAQILALEEGITLSQGQLADLNQQLADAVQQGAIAVFNAVQQGKQNLNTIGQSIATDIGTYIDTPLVLAGNALQLHADRITATYAGLNASLDRETAQIGLRADTLALKNLGRSILIPGAGALSSTPTVALAELNKYLAKIPEASRGPLQAFIDQYESAFIKVRKDHVALAEAVTPARATAGANLRVSQDIATTTKLETTKAFADITDLFNKKKIQWGTLSADVVQILKRDKVNFADAARVDGIAFVDRFTGELSGLRQQTLANLAGPQQPGTGLLPTIVHPLSVLQNTEKQIASISHSIASNQLSELKAHTKILQLIHGAQRGAAATSLTSNPGGATRRHTALAGVSG